ncbi:MAG: hypothetical protein QNI99_06070 [Woeseiaceae bacterium]|nr:hypothetical protein [Woeseiaceae bacterium]
MALDGQRLLGDMLDAVQGVVAGRWPDIQNLAEEELEGLAQIFLRIEARKLQNKISDEEAAMLLRMHRRAVEAVLASIEGMTLIMAEMAINAAMDAVKNAVNSAVGFDLL